MHYNNIDGVPEFEAIEYSDKKSDYCVLIPILNEGSRIAKELERAKNSGIDALCDIVICDANSTDGSTDEKMLRKFGVNTLLVKLGKGKQGAQLRMGFWWAVQRSYKGFITIDGNNKDSIEDIPLFIDKLKEGYDFIQGSRFVTGGKAINTPFMRYISIRMLHAPIISLTARRWFTDTTNAYRAYSLRYIIDPRLQIFRDIFSTYELLAYLSVRATQLGLRACEVPVSREYPKGVKTPTKISPIKGNWMLLKILILNFIGKYNPDMKTNKE